MLSIGSKITAKKALLLLIFFGVLFLQIKLHISLNQKVSSETNTSFVINKGENLYSVLAELEDKYDLHSTWWIRFNYIFKEAPVIKTGRYNILPNYSIKDLINAFENGDVQQFKFTVIEGTVAKNNLKKLKEIIKEEISESLDPVLEGLFLKEALIAPDTYFFSTQEDLIAVLESSRSYLDDYLESIWKQKPSGNPLKSIDEAMVLASIIERESLLASEMPTIASVFLFRLQKGMRLQADPTSAYGYYGEYGDKIGRAVLDDNNQFNTYRINGLPPSPICYPSQGAIEAAIKSVPGNYLYFVAKGDGSHVFSKTYEEHNKAVKKYIYSK
ncbi:MAG: endolytic transglycosylase MltG [SAR86 cluster bacterium]|nr:endolytic transglycosylase MltG [SAR86 cluster bacterium]MBL6810738.1 endolytic transglycosylase MltG [SAR86 cluster bacterium]